MTMTAYILPLLSAILAAAVVELLAPKGEGGRLAAQIRMIAGLFLLAALLQPIREGIALLRDAATGQLADRLEAVILDVTPEDYESALGDTLTSVGREEVEAWVGNLLETRFSVPPSGCTVFAACDCTDRTLCITEVRISLHGQYVLQDPHPIEKAVTEALGCPCYVTVD